VQPKGLERFATDMSPQVLFGFPQFGQDEAIRKVNVGGEPVQNASLFAIRRSLTMVGVGEPTRSDWGLQACSGS
jgi:hypothetical protein